MRTLTLFIAMSLDGFIADKNGGVNWLGGQDPVGEDMRTYEAFIQDIDTVVMGWNTYRQLKEELAPDEWPYADRLTYVFTHRDLPLRENIRFVNESGIALIRAWKAGPGRGIWLCGGAQLARQLLRENLIDVLHINLIPTLLGSGIRLFGELEEEIPLQLLRTQSYNGITDLVYTRRA